MSWVALVGAMLVFAGGQLAAAGEPLPPAESYVGSEACGDCHRARYDGWKETYHASVVRDVRKDPAAVLGDFTSADMEFPLEDVEYVIGSHWYQRYVVRIGADRFVLPKMWSVASHRWETQGQWSWKRKPYHVYCIGCHATRYDPELRTSVEHVVGCESCHGPGRRHAETAGAVAIYNPADVDADEQDLLCASCHVRGMDPSGQYYFAVGYVPGRRLEEHYVPFRVEDGESAREAFLRLFRSWRDRVGRGAPPTCDVCGIPRDQEQDAATSTTDHCLKCHTYGEDYGSHTRHPSELRLECLDCHQQVASAMLARADVHWGDYYKVHRGQAFDGEVRGSCRGCHAELSEEELAEVLQRWDHSAHTPSD